MHLSHLAATLLLALSALPTSVSALSSHVQQPNTNPNHRALAARQAGLAAHERALLLSAEEAVGVPPSGAALRKRGAGSTCKSKSATAGASSSSSSATTAFNTASVKPVLVVAPTTSTSTKKTTTTAATTTTTAAPTSAATSASGSKGVLSLYDATCGSSQATSQTSNTGGPNGKESWLTCGINNGGWTPPFISMSELKYADLATVIASGNSPFGNCAAYIDKFYAVGATYSIPPILLASFAMQESSCNPSAVGGGGEQGMFQISKDKCTGAPGGNCKDVDFNMNKAMSYFSDTLSSVGGSVLLAIGQYNGWYSGMTQASATAARYTSCCRCQNNLDYVHQMLNGWMMGLDGDNYGTYFNLASC